jgi:hypothetical protein
VAGERADDDGHADLDDVASTLRRRAERYLDHWERAADKLRRSEYRADDLVEDAFWLWGNALRDTSAVATWMWRAAAAPGRWRGTPQRRR